tara:strand:+ start:139 stop:708 length:570 start_codon:yes stop_codon:yes gene_type:complete
MSSLNDDQPRHNKKKRLSKEHYTKDAVLAKKRKVFQNAKVIQKFRKVREQETKRQKQETQTIANKPDTYEQIFAGTDDAETQLVGNLKGRDKRYQDKKNSGKQPYRQQQHQTQRPNPYQKVVNTREREEKETQEQIETRKKNLKDGLHKRKKNAKKLKRRSRRGQPVMENHIDGILAQLQADASEARRR